MAVRGIGFDLVSISQFAAQLARPGTLMHRHFTPSERRACAHAVDGPDRQYATRWAAKEALIKAWSVSRFGRPQLMSSVDYQDIELITDNWGRPSLQVHGAIREYLSDATIHVSLTHEGDMAGAFVIVEE
ncbi:holo-ACP synthase [Hoyosella rhizosphaerae]|nr:holo-ACP synthase [Hoyosella rhizosphaerae]MBN4925844.1 holo-ACP synthase [Hoyosella rhizosphaerae]